MLIVTSQANRLDRFGAGRPQWSFRGASIGRRVPTAVGESFYARDNGK
jgi:hypothetical protein